MNNKCYSCLKAVCTGHLLQFSLCVGALALVPTMPSCAQVLEPCKDSRVFKPPNPWLQGILALVAEIYGQDKLKLNLKFEIEMMFRNLNLQIGDAKPSQSLARHKRQIINNADFTADKPMPPPQQAPVPEKQARPPPVELSVLLLSLSSVYVGQLSERHLMPLPAQPTFGLLAHQTHQLCLLLDTSPLYSKTFGGSAKGMKKE